MPEQSLKDKTIKGVGWSAVDNISSYVVRFIIGIILARLLSPDDYGLIGLTGIFTAICDSLINCGFGTALIRKKDCTEDDYNTAFVVNLTISIILYFVIFACAPFIARFFEREELTALTRVSSISMIIGALSLVQGTRLTKKIDFKTQTKISLISSITSGIAGIVGAFAGMGVWSLVLQGIVSCALGSGLLIYFNRWFPSFRFSATSFKEMFGFGWKLMASRLLDSVWRQINQVIVGKFYSPATLGQYTRADGYSQLFSLNLTGIVQRVTFPVLSNIQDERNRMISAFRRIIKLTMFITFTCMFGLGAISKPLIICMIGEKWTEASEYLPLLCLTSALYPLHIVNLNMLQIQGRSDLFLGLEIIKKIIGLIPLFVGAFIGIMPMLYTNILISIISFFLNSYFSGKLLGYSSWMQLRDIAPSFFLAIIMATPVYLMKFLPLSNWIILPMQIIVGIIIFTIECNITKLPEYKEAIDIIKSMVKSLAKR